MAIFNFFSVSSWGKGLSGGDRIYMEFARRWSKKHKVTIFVTPDGYKMCQAQNLDRNSNLDFGVQQGFGLGVFKGYVNYFLRIPLSVKLGLKMKIENPNGTYIYSSSEFLMDSLPAWILKLRYPEVFWVAAWYQTAPSPFVGFAEGARNNVYRLKSFVYWLQQKVAKPLILQKANFVLVNNAMERQQFPKHTKNGKIAVVLGAVDVEKINEYRSQVTGHKSPVYDAVFQGRFHPQKGVVELVDIWKKVVDYRPDATLAMVGDGPLMKEVKLQITNYKLQNNIKLFGFLMDGEKKYKVFAGSKLAVHPAFYDSGGMASAEAMAFGIPCVGFDLSAYESYYPQGMLKVKKGDLDAFADAILELLRKDTMRNRLGAEAQKMVETMLSWKVRADEVLAKILE